MLKTKTKAFKPKGPSKPRPAPSREPTTEPTAAEKDPIPNAKRKEREEDDISITEPPAKRIPIPTPTVSVTAQVQAHPLASQTAPEPSQHPLPTPASTPTEVPQAIPTPRTLPPKSPATPRKQLPSAPAAVITTSDPSAPAKQPTPNDLPSAVDEAPSRSISGASLGPAGGAILSTPAALPSARRASLSSTGTISVLRTTPKGSLGAAGSSVIPASPARSAPKGNLGGAGSSVIPASHIQSAPGGSLGPAGGSIISNARNHLGVGPIAPALGPAGDVGEESDAGPSRVSQLVPMAALNPDGTPGGIIETPVKKKRTVRRKQAKAATDDDRATIDLQVERPRLKKGTAAAKKVKEKKKRKKKEKPVRKRDDTPESAEDEIVDPAVLTMSELCVDLRIGKKFSRHNEIKERLEKQKAVVKAARAARENPQAAEEGQEAGEPGEAGGEAGPPVEGGEPVEAAPEAEPVVAAQSQTILMRIVDGQIVIDDRSTQLDRHREGQAEEGSTEVIEENDFSKITTSGTLMKREKKHTWDWAAMEMFYKGLRTFGTDFGMIANMFPHRTRKQIKSRFNMEERDNPERINRVLSQPLLPLDIDEYEELSRDKYVEVSEIQAESQALEDEHNATQAQNDAEQAAAVQKKKDAIRKQSKNPARDFLDALSDGEDDHGSSAKENRVPSGSRSREQSAAATSSGRRKKGLGKAKQGNKHSMRAGGEEFEVVDG